MYLYKKLPDSIIVGEVEYIVDMAYDTVLYVESLVKEMKKIIDSDEGYSGEKREVDILLYIVDIYNNIFGEGGYTESMLMDYDSIIVEYFQVVSDVDGKRGKVRYYEDILGNKFIPPRNSKKVEEDASSTRFIDFNQDWGSIYSSMLEQYGIDIMEEDSLHWYKFVMLIRGLSSETSMGSIMEIRGKDISSIRDSKERNKYIKLKNYYRLDGVELVDEDSIGITYGEV